MPIILTSGLQIRKGGKGAALYDVQELPRNWLIDRDGRIIAHDLSLPELAERLRVLCGK